MPVAAHALGPLGWVPLPDGCVVIQRKAEVVVDQILAGCLQFESKQTLFNCNRLYHP